MSWIRVRRMQISLKYAIGKKIRSYQLWMLVLFACSALTLFSRNLHSSTQWANSWQTSDSRTGQSSSNDQISSDGPHQLRAAKSISNIFTVFAASKSHNELSWVQQEAPIRVPMQDSIRDQVHKVLDTLYAKASASVRLRYASALRFEPSKPASKPVLEPDKQSGQLDYDRLIALFLAERHATSARLQNGLTDNWQPVVGAQHKSRVYSAYLENRQPASRFLRIIAATRTRTEQRFYCNLWYFQASQLFRGPTAKSSGAQFADSQSSGAQSSGAQSSGAQSSGPQSSGPQSSGARFADPQSSGAQFADPQSSGAQFANPQSSGPQSEKAFRWSANRSRYKLKLLVVRANVRLIRENWNLKYSAYFFLCPLADDHPVPDAVSIVVNCTKLNHSANLQSDSDYSDTVLDSNQSPAMAGLDAPLMSTSFTDSAKQTNHFHQIGNLLLVQDNQQRYSFIPDLANVHLSWNNLHKKSPINQISFPTNFGENAEKNAEFSDSADQIKTNSRNWSNNQAKSANLNEIAVCVKPVHYDYDRLSNLIEFFELNQLLGVSHFVLYNHSMSSRVDCLLDKIYSKAGKLTLLPWHGLDMVSQKEIRTQGIFASLNDCLYRTMYRYRFVLMIDFDEFVMPQLDSDLHQLIARLSFFSSGLDRVGAFSFQNAFYYTQWPDDAGYSELELKNNLENDDDQWSKQKSISALANSPAKIRLLLTSLAKTRRKNMMHRHRQRSKCIVLPLNTVEVGNHFVWQFSPGKMSVHVGPKAAHLHHYRVCEFGGTDCLNSISTVDRRAYHWSDQLIRNAKSVWLNFNQSC